MDWERDEHRPRYRLCRAAFLLCALGTGLMVLDSAAGVAFFLTWQPEIMDFIASPLWQWAAGSTIVWSSLLGASLLWGRWSEPDWKRRSGYLVLLSLAGIVFWVVRHGETFGLGPAELGHRWLRIQLMIGARWVWLGVVASLAYSVVAHLGREEAGESLASILALVVAGVIVWAILVLYQTDWELGWPLRPRPGLNLLTWLLWLGLSAIRGLAGFLVTVLCLLAARECSQILRELDHAEDLILGVSSHTSSLRFGEPSHGDHRAF